MRIAVRILLLAMILMPAPLLAAENSVAMLWARGMRGELDRLENQIAAVENGIIRLEHTRQRTETNTGCPKTDCGKLADLVALAMRANREITDAQSIARVAREHFEQVTESDEGLERRLRELLGDTEETQALRNFFVGLGNFSGGILAGTITGQPADMTQALKVLAAASGDYLAGKGWDAASGWPSAASRRAAAVTYEAGGGHALAGTAKTLSSNMASLGVFGYENGRLLFRPRLGIFNADPRRKEVTDSGAIIGMAVQAAIAAFTEGSLQSGKEDILKAGKALVNLLRLKADYAAALSVHRTFFPRLKNLRKRAINLEYRLRKLASRCLANKARLASDLAYAAALAKAERMRDTAIARAEDNLRKARSREQTLQETRAKLWDGLEQVHGKRLRRKAALAKAEDLQANRSVDREIADSPYATPAARRRARARLEDLRRLGPPEAIRQEVNALESREQALRKELRDNARALREAGKARRRAAAQAQQDRLAARKAWRSAIARAERTRIRTSTGGPSLPGPDFNRTRYENIRQRFETGTERAGRKIVTLPTPEEIFSASQTAYGALRKQLFAPTLKSRQKEGKDCPGKKAPVREQKRSSGPKIRKGRGDGIIGTFRYSLDGASVLFVSVTLQMDPQSCLNCRGVIYMQTDDDLNGVFAETGEMNSVFARFGTQIFRQSAATPAQQGLFRAGYTSGHDFALRIVIEGTELDRLRWQLRVEDSRMFSPQIPAPAATVPAPAPVFAPPPAAIPAPPMAPEDH